MKPAHVIIAAAALSFGVPAASHAATVTYNDGKISYAEKTPWGDIDIAFANCMANNLYTFSSVSIDGIEVNHTESDNIGPFAVNGYWMGGNHNDVTTKKPTANTVSFKIKVDEEPVTPPKPWKEKYLSSTSKTNSSTPTARNSPPNTCHISFQATASKSMPNMSSNIPRP